jgi:hypothetical protein
MVPTLKPDKAPPPLLLTATVCAAGLLPPAVAVKLTVAGERAIVAGGTCVCSGELGLFLLHDTAAATGVRSAAQTAATRQTNGRRRWRSRFALMGTSFRMQP